MAKGPARISQATIKRAIKAAQDCGLSIARVHCGADGGLEIITGQPASEALQSPLDKWLEKRNAG